MTTTAYPLDNWHDAATAHHRALADLLDPFTRQRILALPNWPSARCALEVGAGHGSIAYWLADQPGPHREVVACDLKPDQIPAHPRLQVVAHDLTTDAELAPVVGEGFDLIHARLTLQHLPNRRAILRRLARLLAPGGTLLTEDWVALWGASLPEVVLAAPSADAAKLYHRFLQADGRVFATAGSDPTWAPRACAEMAEAGLVDVTTVVHGEYWRGGGPALRLLWAGAEQIRSKLVATGMTEPELDQLAELINDPQLLVHPHLLYSTSGRSPGWRDRAGGGSPLRMRP